MTDAPTLKIDGVRYIVTMDAHRRIVADGSVVINRQPHQPGWQSRRTFVSRG